MEIIEDKDLDLTSFFKKYSVLLLFLGIVLVLSFFVIIVANKNILSQKRLKNAYASTGRDWYVSKIASPGGDGTSWTSAWNEMSNINWSVIQPGDNINLDGGTSQLVYTTPLIPSKSGVSGSPITIKLSAESGRNGQVVIFGGRTTPLPECETPLANYTYQTTGVNLAGMDFSIASPSWITVDGTKWRGIVIYGHNLTGIKLSSGNQNDTFSNMELYDNGEAVKYPLGGPYDRWRPDEPGVLAHGTNITFDHMLIHDNGQDVFQSSGGVNNFTITNSWLYNGRAHSTNPSLAYNYCMHSDGFQVYNGGVQSGITFDHDIIGPGLMQGTILGQTYPAPTPATVVNNVTLRDVLILDTTNANIMGYPTVSESGWTIDHVTSFHVAYDPDGNQHHALYAQFAGATISNSIFSGGQVYLPGTQSYSGNIIYNLTGQPSGFGTNQNPQFTNAPAYTGTQPTLSDYINGNYDFTSPSGVGSRLTSITQLLGAPQGTPTPVPSNNPTSTPAPLTPTVTSAPTNIPTPTPTVILEGTNTPTPVPPTPTFTPIPTPTRTPTPVPPTPTRTPTPIPPTPTRTPTPVQVALSFQAESGNITLPMRINGSYIYQNVETTLNNSGSARYIFNVPQSGNYIVTGYVKAPNHGANSFWVNIDAEPIDPNSIWDIPVQSGYQMKTVSWRNTGGAETNMNVAHVFYLVQGAHQLIIRGREANTLLDAIYINSR